MLVRSSDLPIHILVSIRRVLVGPGYFILDTRDRLAYSELMATVLFIGFLGFLLDAAARGLCQLAAGRR